MLTPYVEIVFEGSPEAVRRLAESGDLGDPESEVFVSSDLGIIGEGRIHHILSVLHVVAEHTHVLIPAEKLPGVRARLAKSSDSIRILAAHEVLETHFHFSFACYSKEHAQKIRQILDDLPEGVKLADFQADTRDDIEARGQELYSPVHDFEYEGKGLVTGTVKGLGAWRKIAEDEPLIKMEKIAVVLGRDLLADDADDS
ncbi:MAG: hypothetical protein H6684_03240 [Deltaproteobacteria bacterium]|nr:hypothetical protein [bacterium]MCB9480005.1 hypothetical protein [Deltaproteobacteria bacterium]MCB9487728.1 hypothetical protein [Deltaproteobacteria bacterium]